MAEQQNYTVDIPGLTDVFRVPLPGVDEQELARQRAVRIATSNSAMPEPLEWASSVVQVLDDAEDMLSVGLALSKPLLKRLPSRLIPGLGWLLLGKDLIELLNNYMALATGTLEKLDYREDARKRKDGRKANIRRADDFLNGKTNKLGFILDAGQVLQNFTGYGIALGSVEGFVQDSFWSAIRDPSGRRTEIRGPPSEDPTSQAAEFLATSSFDSMTRGEISLDDHLLVLAARSIATQIITETRSPGPGRLEAGGVAEQPVPVRRPYKASVRAGLRDAGIDPDGPIRPPSLSDKPEPTFADHIPPKIARRDEFPQMAKDGWGGRDEGAIAQLLYNEAGEDAMAWLNGGSVGWWYELIDAEWSGMRMIECGCWPNTWLDPESVRLFLIEALDIANGFGRENPTCSDFWNTANRWVFDRLYERFPVDVEELNEIRRKCSPF